MLEEFEKFLQAHLFKVQSFHPHFNEAYRQMFESGGKRFRPLLLLNVVNAYSPLLLNASMHAALALEMIHTYSLIHDDLPSMDNASLRRGSPTLHVTYDETTAILIGDALNTDAFLTLSRSPLDAKTKVRLCEILSFNAGSGGMALGQAIDCYFENNPLDEVELEFLHTHKTAKLIAAALQMGSVIAGLSSEEEEKLYSFGLELGLLFQIQDDIIDATQSKKEAGKPTMNDTNKNSFVNLLGLTETVKRRDAKVKELKTKAESFGALSSYFQKVLDTNFK
ncbi:MAG: polyprenyl synthetase family protein [Campylobacteraceae bacterium]|jgi:farnesyl diphosphate synthase|nr:polyprenyl synthetase family protein [Campylobacteraceae bacterium]